MSMSACSMPRMPVGSLVIFIKNLSKDEGPVDKVESEQLKKRFRKREGGGHQRGFIFWEGIFSWLQEKELGCFSLKEFSWCLIPHPASGAVERWLKYLREELLAVAFKCSIQEQRTKLGWRSKSKVAKPNNLLQTSVCFDAETFIKLLKSYSRSHEKPMSELLLQLGMNLSFCSNTDLWPIDRSSPDRFLKMERLENHLCMLM